MVKLCNFKIYAIKEVIDMKVCVTVDICQGVVDDIQVLLTEKSALEIEQTWLQSHDVKNELDRQCKAQNGTELLIFECQLRL